MKFRAHDTFAIRKGWLNKGLRNVKVTPDVFISKGENPMVGATVACAVAVEEAMKG